MTLVCFLQHAAKSCTERRRAAGPARAPARARAARPSGADAMQPLPISVFIIAKNEADRIGDTIRAVRDLTDDLVVVDSGSEDGTQEVAAALGAHVLVNAWPGYGPQKRFAEDECRHDWL